MIAPNDSIYILLNICINIPPAFATISNLTVIDGQCSDSTSDLCEISFHSDLRVALSVENVLLGTWGLSILKIESPFLDSKGGNACEIIENGVLRLTIGSSFTARCRFHLQSGASELAQSSPSDPNLILPAIIFFNKVPLFRTTDLRCTNPLFYDDCSGVFHLPVATFPIIVKTTSLIAIDNCTIPIAVAIIDQLPVFGSIYVFLYQFTLPQEYLEQALLQDSILCNVHLSKSPFSPLLRYYTLPAAQRSSAIDIPPATTKLSSIHDFAFITRSTNVVFSSIAAYPSSGDCLVHTNNRCTILFEIPFYHDVEDIFVVPRQYFLEAQEQIIHPCSESEINLVTISSLRTDTNYTLLCKSYRKTFDTNTSRANLPIEIIFDFFGESVTGQSTTLNIENIQYICPVYVEFDEEDCKNEFLPTCTVIVRSFYQGPQLSMAFDRFPYSGVVDQFVCDSNQMSMNRNHGVDWPARKSSGFATAKTNIATLPPGDPYTTFHECRALIFVGLGTVYDFTNHPLRVTYHSEGAMAVETILTDFHPVTQNLPILDGAAVKYNKLPLRFAPQNDCSERFDMYCTMEISTTFDPIHPYNNMHSFEIYFPGYDKDYLLIHGKYELFSSGFVTDKNALIELFTLPDSSEFNPFGIEIVYFRITIDSSSRNESLYFDATNTPTKITIQYRKAARVTLTGQFPYLLSYAGVLPSIQPNWVECMPTHSTGFDLIAFTTMSVEFQPDCLSPGAITCSSIIYRDDDNHTESFIAITIGDAGLASFTILNENLKPIQSTPYTIKSSDITISRVPWSQFRKNPQDDNEPLPKSILLHFFRHVGSVADFVAYNFDMTDDPSNPGELTVLRSTQFISKSPFTVDALPVFSSDCSAHTIPFCTVTYTIQGGDLPSNWIIIEHPLPGPGVMHAIHEFECTNVCTEETTLEGSCINRLALGAIEAKINFANDPLNDSLHTNVDSFTLSTPKSQEVWRYDDKQSIICTVKFSLENAISPPQYRLTPWIIHTQSPDSMRVSIFLPRVAFAPTRLDYGRNCLTQSSTLESCTMSVYFYGTKQLPIEILQSALPDSIPAHPLIPQGKYNLYLDRRLSSTLINPDQDDADAVATFSLFLQTSGPYKGKRLFTFNVHEQYRAETFVAYFTVANPVVPGVQFLVPGFTLSYDLNLLPSPVSPAFYIPALLSGVVLLKRSNQTIFTTPGVALSTFQLKRPTIDVLIETNFNFQGRVPCLETTSNISIRDVNDRVPYNDYAQLSSITDLNEQSNFFATLSKRFPDSQINQPRIIGWFEPYYTDEFIPQLTRRRKVTFTKFKINPLYTSNPGNCMFYHQVNSFFPSHTSNVKHSITIPDLPTDVLDAYIGYSSLSYSATLHPPKKK